MGGVSAESRKNLRKVDNRLLTNKLYRVQIDTSQVIRGSEVREFSSYCMGIWFISLRRYNAIEDSEVSALAD